MVSWDSLPAWVQVVDIIFWSVFVLYVGAATYAWSRQAKKERSSDERGLAVSAVGNFINISIVAASALLAGVGVLAGLALGKDVLLAEVFTQLSLTGVWLALSLFSGAVPAAYGVSHVHHKQSIAENTLTMSFATAQLYSVVAGAVFLTVALFLF